MIKFKWLEMTPLAYLESKDFHCATYDGFQLWPNSLTLLWHLSPHSEFYYGFQ